MADDSFSLTTFNRMGKLAQIEYALRAVQSGETSLAIKATNGVVIGTEKKMASILMDPHSIQKVSKITDHIGVVYSGLGPDFRVVLKYARKEAVKYFSVYKKQIPCSILVSKMANIMQQYTQSGGVRPFGVSMLVAGFDFKGPHLYQVDPSGSFWSWKASALGKNMINANTFLEKRFQDNIEIEDAIHTALLTLKEGFDGQITKDNIEIGVVRDDKHFKRLSPEEIQDYLEEVDKW